MSAKSLRVAVVGGGIIGCSIAWALARRGACVTVYDAGKAGTASPASGGMLSAVAEGSQTAGDLERDARLSRDLWPAFAADLERAANETIGLDLSGNVLIALSDEHASALARRAANPDGELRQADRAIEPGLSGQVRAVYLAARDGLVDPRRTLLALARGLDRCGARCVSSQVDQIEIRAGRAVGIRGADGSAPADAVVLAAGVWSQALAVASGLEGVAPLRPVKGQMLSLRMAGPPLRRVVRSAHAYLIPRGERVLVGATSEPDVWDPAVTEEAIAHLMACARSLSPGLAGTEILDAWAGLRPALAVERPLVGSCEVPGLFLALGHYRNGILLAPLTAQRVADEIVRAAG